MQRQPKQKGYCHVTVALFGVKVLMENPEKAVEDLNLAQTLVDWSNTLSQIYKDNPAVLEVTDPDDAPEVVTAIYDAYGKMTEVFTQAVPLPRNVTVACVEKAMEREGVEEMGKMELEQATEVASLTLQYMVKARKIISGLQP